MKKSQKFAQEINRLAGDYERAGTVQLSSVQESEGKVEEEKKVAEVQYDQRQLIGNRHFLTQTTPSFPSLFSNE